MSVPFVTFIHTFIVTCIFHGVEHTAQYLFPTRFMPLPQLLCPRIQQMGRKPQVSVDHAGVADVTVIKNVCCLTADTDLQGLNGTDMGADTREGGRGDVPLKIVIFIVKIMTDFRYSKRYILVRPINDNFLAKKNNW